MSPVPPCGYDYRVRYDYIFTLDPNGDPRRVAYPYRVLVQSATRRDPGCPV